MSDKMRPGFVGADYLAETDTPAGSRLALGAELGRGGTSTVRRAFDPALRRQTAVKVFESRRFEGASPFQAEAQIMGQLEHPNIVPVHELGTTPDGQRFFSMKLVEGETLEEAVARAGRTRLEPEPLTRFLKAFTKVCDALAYAHSRGVIHRDLKPSNIMLGAFGQVYVMDWGTARLLPTRTDIELSDPAALPTEARGVVVGTPAYMPPEQARGQNDRVDERADIFCLGATLYHVLTGRPPYEGPTALAVAMQAAAAQPPAVESLASGVHPLLARIVRTAMAPEPADRFQSVAELQAQVEAYLLGTPALPERTFPAGTAILREGEEGDTAYIIVRGACEVYRTAGGQRVDVAELRPGDVFGEAGVLTGKPRTATVEAVMETTVVEVSRQTLSETLRLRSWMGLFVTAIADRFRESDARVQALERQLARQSRTP